MKPRIRHTRPDGRKSRPSQCSLASAAAASSQPVSSPASVSISASVSLPWPSSFPNSPDLAGRISSPEQVSVKRPASGPVPDRPSETPDWPCPRPDASLEALLASRSSSCSSWRFRSPSPLLRFRRWYSPDAVALKHAADWLRCRGLRG